MPDTFDPSLLDVCEQERLDRIGSIQPFGVLLGGDAGDERVRVASADAGVWLGLPGAAVLDRPLGKLLPIRLSDFPAEPGHKRMVPGLIETSRGWLDALLCNTGPEWLLELEPLGTDDPLLPLSNPLLGRLLQAPQSEPEMDDYAQALVEAVRHATGYHRALVYRFLPDGCGEAIAESSADGDIRYRGLRFPASDIPKIARDLYRINSHRQVPDVEAIPVPIMSSLPGREADLTLSDLRAVSPVHIEYLKNMDVAGSLSFSIVVGGVLWGLVACHHRDPRFLSLRVRGRCVELTQSFALGIGSYLANQRLWRVTGMEERLATLAELVLDGEAGLPPMSLVGPAMLDLFQALGVAVVDAQGCMSSVPRRRWRRSSPSTAGSWARAAINYWPRTGSGPSPACPWTRPVLPGCLRCRPGQSRGGSRPTLLLVSPGAAAHGALGRGPCQTTRSGLGLGYLESAPLLRSVGEDHPRVQRPLERAGPDGRPHASAHPAARRLQSRLTFRIALNRALCGMRCSWIRSPPESSAIVVSPRFRRWFFGRPPVRGRCRAPGRWPTARDRRGWRSAGAVCVHRCGGS